MKGAWIIAVPRVPDQSTQELGELFPAGEFVYFHDQERSVLVGPWAVDRTGMSAVPAYEPWAVLQYADSVLEQSPVDMVGDRPFLLQELPAEEGELLDLAGPERLAQWLAGQLGSVSSDLIESFNHSHPDWREQLRESLTQVSNPLRRRLHRLRWTRLEPMLDSLLEQNEVLYRLLSENPTMQALVQSNLHHQLDRAREGQWQQARRELEREWPEASPGPAGSRPASLCLPVVPVAPNPDALTALPAFLEERLVPAMQSWIPGVKSLHCLHLHSALLACPMVHVPGPAWTRAYAQAVGARHEAFSAGPTWLDVSDLWKAGFQYSWTRAWEEPDRLHLVCLDRVDQSYCSAWLRPLLLLAGGLSERLLPSLPAGWPHNLRICLTWTETRGEFPIEPSVVSALACVKAGSGTSAPQVANLPEQEVAWSAWSVALGFASIAHPQARSLGDFYLAGCRDINRLTRALMAHGEEEESALMKAIRMRVEWPAGLLAAGEGT